MMVRTVCLTTVFFLLSLSASAAQIMNLGFEQGMEGWTETDPNHKNGVLYVAHEPVGEDDVYYDLVGKKNDRTSDQANGIALDEVFSYEINAKGHTLETRILQNGAVIGQAIIDQSKSGYDVEKEYNYFKAGSYNQNHTGDPDDYAQTTFYELKAEH